MFVRAPHHVRWQCAIVCCLMLATSRLHAQGSLGGVIGATVANGMIVDEVPAGSAGARAGLQRGDIVNAFNGVPITSLEALQAQLAQSRPGATVTLGVIRAGRTYQTTTTLQAPRAVAAPSAAITPAPPPAPAAQGTADGPGIPTGTYNCRNRTVNGYNVVLTIRVKDATSYAVIGDNTERPGQYRFDARHGVVNWLSGPLKANSVDNNRAADFEQERIPPAKVLTVYRGFTATRCILSE